jgi:NADH-quinone oxidoreductase subunit M
MVKFGFGCDMSGILLATIVIPIAGAIVCGASGTSRRELPRLVTLVTATVTLLLAAWLTAGFLRAVPGAEPYAIFDRPWLPESSGIDVRISLGLDGLNLWLFDLTALLIFTSVLVSWRAIDDSPALFYAMLLLLEAGCLGVFVARDIILFYVFFEFTLIPLYLLIGIWGSEERRYAAIKFFLYTLAGSLLTFLGLVTIVLWVFFVSSPPQLTFSIPALTDELTAHPLDPTLQRWVFLALFAGFAIKVPLFPLHTWLPLAHVQAPTAGSVILAGVLLKIGTYGFVRFSLPMLPEATAACMPWLVWLSVAGIIYGALVSLAQTDIKRLIAYSSVSHLGFCMLGVFALNQLGAQGALLQMVNHGISTGALFAIVGMLYERYHTRAIGSLGGLARQVPILSFFTLLFALSSIGLPGLNGFAGEILILLGAFQRGWGGMASFGHLHVAAIVAVLGVVLGAWYMLWLVQRVFFGPVKTPGNQDHPACDLSWREIVALAPLALLVVWIGLWPQFFLHPTAAPLAHLTQPARQNVEKLEVERTAAMKPEAPLCASGFP